MLASRAGLLGLRPRPSARACARPALRAERTRVSTLFCKAAAKPKSGVLGRLGERDLTGGALGDGCSQRSAFGPFLRNVLIGYAAQSEHLACRLHGGCSAC